VITTCHQEASSAPEQLSIPSQRDEEFKRCPQQILGTVVAVNSITGLYPQYTTTMYIYIYESSHDIPIKHDIPMIFPLYLSLVYDFGRCFLIVCAVFSPELTFFSQVWKVNLWISQ
jgi:hypothetical protein